MTERDGHVTTYTYTDYANVETVTRQGDPGDPLDDQVTQYRYYEDGGGKESSLWEIEDALGNVTEYTYPAQNRGRPETITLPEGTATADPTNDYVTEYVYNGAGQVTRRISHLEEATWVTQEFTYDSEGTVATSSQAYFSDSDGDPTTPTAPGRRAARPRASDTTGTGASGSSPTRWATSRRIPHTPPTTSTTS